MTRLVAIDDLRGIAIILMVVYHFLFDLNYLGIAPIPLGNPFIIIFQRSIGILFIGIAGISIALSEQKNTKGWIHHARRGLFLTGIALLITAVTWVYPHDGFIQFGIIHLMAASVLLAPLFFRLKTANVLIGLLVGIAGLLTPFVSTTNPFLFWLGLITPEYYALDHYPLLPWFGVFLIGMGLAFSKEFRQAVQQFPMQWHREVFSWLGKKSLAIYLIHQPLLIGLLMAGKIAGFW